MKKTTIALILVMLALSMFSSVFVDVAEADVILESGIVFVVGDIRYSTNQTLYCERIERADTYFLINNTGFNVTTTNPLSVTIIRIDDDFNGAAKNDAVLDFYATCTGGTVTFQISGMSSQRNYIIKRDGLVLAYPTASVGGVVTFSNDQWSTRHFVLYDDVDGSGDPGPGDGENDISIYVYDSGYIPIFNAFVTIYVGLDPIDSGYTDAGGLFETILDDGIYTVEIMADGYNTLTDVIVVDGNENFVFYLDASTEYMGFVILGGVAVAIVAVIYVCYSYYNYKKSSRRRG